MNRNENGPSRTEPLRFTLFWLTNPARGDALHGNQTLGHAQKML